MNLRNSPLFFSLRFNKKLYERQFCKCEQVVTICAPKPKPITSVTIIGANSKVGQISGMLFKRKKIFKKLYLYDKKSCTNLACDLNMINGSPAIIKSYYGIRNLERAVKKARIVYICGGIQNSPGFSEQDLFDRNAGWVRQAITYCAEFNPNTHVVITTPPVSFLVPMAIEEFRKSNISAEKRVYGLTRTLVSRSNSFAGDVMKVEPSSVNSFVVGGCHKRTFIPILSHLQGEGGGAKIPHVQGLTDKIQDAEDAALRQKMRETNSTGCYLSIAYNGVEFTTKLARALEGEEKIMECAFVKQDKPMEEYAKYFSCVATLDQDGVKSCHIPKMSSLEKNRLKQVINEIRHNIFLGSSYVTGDDMIVVRNVPKPEKKEEKAAKPAKTEKKDKDKNVCPPKPKPPRTLKVIVTN